MFSLRLQYLNYSESLICVRFISWDLETSEVCRDVDPGAQGLMLGLAISADNRFVASFTSSFQVRTGNV